MVHFVQYKSVGGVRAEYGFSSFIPSIRLTFFSVSSHLVMAGIEDPVRSLRAMIASLMSTIVVMVDVDGGGWKCFFSTAVFVCEKVIFLVFVFFRCFQRNITAFLYAIVEKIVVHESSRMKMSNRINRE
jgi:hypothetical protein